MHHNEKKRILRINHCYTIARRKCRVLTRLVKIKKTLIKYK